MRLKIIAICLFVIAAASLEKAFSQTTTAPRGDFRNFYGICWRGTPHDNLLYAKQMGYDYVFYQKGMELDPLSDGLYFYLESPEYALYNRGISLKKKYTQQQIDFYQEYCALKDTTADFPFNLATGWEGQPGSGMFTVLLDFQQQKVIKFAIDGLLSQIKSIQARNPKFKFAGFSWDEPRPGGDFWVNTNGKRLPVKLDRWNKSDRSARPKRLLNANLSSSASSPAPKDDFPTYTDGHLSYYKQLYKAARAIYPGVHFISEPSKIYEGWIQLIQNRPDAKDITPDILSQENQTTQFVDDSNITASGLVIKKNIFCTTPNIFGEAENRTLAAKAAMNGSGFAWYGRFGGTGDMPNYKSISEVPPRLKLIRLLTNWEDRNGTAVAARTWDGTTYKSKTATASPDVIALNKPGTQKIYVVFLTMQGKVSLPAGKSIATISQTDNFYAESGNGSVDIASQNKILKPKKSDCLGKGYVITLK